MIILIINMIKYIFSISYSLDFVEPADTLVKQRETCYSPKSAYQKLHHELFHLLPFYFICYHSTVGILKRAMPNVCQNMHTCCNLLFNNALYIRTISRMMNHPSITEGSPYKNEKA